jgi:HEAT repeat protein
MTDLKTAQEMIAAAVAAKGTEDPEIASVKRILKLLDKTAKSNRTYGSTNPVALKFSQQLFQELTGHLTTYAKLTFLVQRSELRFNDTIVYETDMSSSGESFAFKLYADGIRELSLFQGLAHEDMMFFLNSLWGGPDPGQDDDDIVTRLWSRNLSTMAIVTAEEVAKSSADGEGTGQTDGVMSSSDSTLRELLDRERKHKGRAGEGADGGGEAATQKKRLQSGLVGYEVTEEELAALATEIESERKRDSLLYIMDVLTAILASEESPPLLTKLFSVWSDILDFLLREGKWRVLEHVVGLLHETDAIRPDLHEEHKQQVASLLNGFGRADRLKAIEAYLNRTPDCSTEGLSTILLLMKPDAVPGLCSLLANLESPAHQAIISEALSVLAKDQPQPVVKGLVDRRPGYVCNLLAILMKWNDPKFAEPVEKLVRYPDVQVRKEVIRALGLLRPSGNGLKLVSFMGDGEESVRIAALKLLVSGQYTVAWSGWLPIVSADDFGDRPMSERRAIFHAIRATCGDEAVPYWEGLLTEWSWTNRKKKEELAVLAAEALGKLGTPAAVSALEHGARKGGAAVRQACAHGLSNAQRRPQKGAAPETTL